MEQENKSERQNEYVDNTRKGFKMNLKGDLDIENLDNARMMNILNNNLLEFSKFNKNT